MRNIGVLVCIFLLAGIVVAQQRVGGHKSETYPTAGSAGEHQGPGDFSQSTIQGCLMGSDVTATYVLTDENTGEIYLVHGNDSLLKQNVGHDVIMTGTATPIRPSDRKGSVGYISPNEPHRTATSANAGQKALNFEITHIQPVSNSCAQQSESQRAAIAASQAALGSVTSRNPRATEPKVGYTAQAQPQGATQPSAPSSPSGPPTPVTGKSGNQGDVAPVTTTGTVGQVTPGFETQSGKAQAPGRQTDLDQGGIAPPQHPSAAQGAPPPPEQVAQNPTDAERIASSAQRGEVNNAQHQLGVNAQPNYNQGAQQQTAQANRPVTGQVQAQPPNKTELPGASQGIKDYERERENQAEQHQQAQPTLVGCLVSGSGKSNHEFFLTEQKSGTRYRLDASPEQLKDHVNHLVEVVGKPAEREGRSKSVAAQNETAFEVTGVQDLAPTCGASR